MIFFKYTKIFSYFLLIAFILNRPLSSYADDKNNKDLPQSTEHHDKVEKDKKDKDTWLTFGVPVKKPKHHHHHKETIEDRCWDDENCKFPTLFCLFFDPDNQKGKCKLPTS